MLEYYQSHFIRNFFFARNFWNICKIPWSNAPKHSQRDSWKRNFSFKEFRMSFLKNSSMNFQKNSRRNNWLKSLCEFQKNTRTFGRTSGRSTREFFIKFPVQFLEELQENFSKNCGIIPGDFLKQFLEKFPVKLLEEYLLITVRNFEKNVAFQRRTLSNKY